MGNPINEFLDRRGIADPIRSAFVAYCKSLYSSRYLFKSNGDTIQIFLSRMTDEQVLQAWNEFVHDMMSVLPTTLT